MAHAKTTLLHRTICCEQPCNASAKAVAQEWTFIAKLLTKILQPQGNDIGFERLHSDCMVGEDTAEYLTLHLADFRTNGRRRF